MNTKSNVVKSNQLAAAMRGFSLGESRLLTCVLAQIHRDDQYSPDKLYTVGAADLVALTKSAPKGHQIQRRNAAQIIHRAAEKLYQRNIVIDLGNGDYIQQRWTSYMEVSPTRSEISFNLAPHMAQYLFNLSEKFHSYRAAEAVAFTSKYSLPIFELLMQWKDKHEHEIKYTTLREAIGIGHKYQEATNFRRKILNPVIADINACTQYEAAVRITTKSGEQWVQFKYYKKKKLNEPKLAQTMPRQLSPAERYMQDLNKNNKV